MKGKVCGNEQSTSCSVVPLTAIEPLTFGTLSNGLLRDSHLRHH
jgi:hypothetical protein